VNAFSRRGFLGTAGALVVGLSVSGPARAGGPPTLTAFLEIAPDGRVKLWSPTTEMGQGTHTAHAMLVADELGVPLSAVSVEAAHPADPFRRNGSMGSGGSWGVRFWHDPLRKASAQAREMLLAEAAARHGVPVAELAIADGVVRHGGRALGGIGAYAEGAAARALPEAPALKPAAERRLVGTRQPRLDLPAKVRGEPVFCFDHQVPGMVYACARLAPVFGGSRAQA
jgi:isoquinoline 1-oxidoreductase beta subunit